MQSRAATKDEPTLHPDDDVIDEAVKEYENLEDEDEADIN